MGKGTIIFLIIVIFVCIAGAIFLVIYLNKEKMQLPGQTKDIEPPVKVKFHMKAWDTVSNNFTNASYSLEYDGIEASKGELLDLTWTYAEAPENHTYSLWCWNDASYVGHAVSEKSKEKERELVCSLDRKGSLSITRRGNLTNESEQRIYVFINATYKYQKLSICWSWSAGITNVITSQKTEYCQNSVWMNWSTYYPENKTYDYLPKGYYRCGSVQDSLEQCTPADYSICYLPPMKIPLRYEGIADSCVYTGKTLNNDGYVLDLNVTIRYPEFINNLDYITIYVFDKDRVRQDDGSWIYLGNDKGKDIAVPDSRYVIESQRG